MSGQLDFGARVRYDPRGYFVEGPRIGFVAARRSTTWASGRVETELLLRSVEKPSTQAYTATWVPESAVEPV